MATPYIGEIKLFGGNFQIRGWAYCDGRLLQIADYDVLFNLLGTTYGGDGVTTFALPNLQSRIALHQGQGPGLTNRTIGETSGSEGVTLLPANLPSHTHQTIATTVPGTASAPANALPATPSLASTEFLYLSGAATGTTDTPPAPSAVSVAGGNQAHNNIMPILALNYLISLEGIYPSQN